MANMKILLFCATQKGYSYLSYFIENNLKDYLAGVISFKETKVQNNYYEDIKSLAEENNLLFFNWQENKAQIENIIIKTGTTHIFLIILSIPEYFRHIFLK